SVENRLAPAYNWAVPLRLAARLVRPFARGFVMESAQVACPKCRAVLRSTAPLPVGAKVQCSACGLKFFVGTGVPPQSNPVPIGALAPGQPPPMSSSGYQPAAPSAPMFFPEPMASGRSVWVFLVPVFLLLLVAGGVTALILVLNNGDTTDN